MIPLTALVPIYAFAPSRLALKVKDGLPDSNSIRADKRAK